MKKVLIFLTLFVPILAFSSVKPELLSDAVYKRASQVEEFSLLKKVAEEFGVKIYLFGGTASAFAHYVKWDLEREQGDQKYQAERFDYDYTNIYRGNQDLDIVIDGTAEQAKQIAAKLQAEYPHFIGNRSGWEVRTLRESIGDKHALLNNFEFQNQHTDSNSIGLIDLTAEKKEEVFRDLLDWENTEPRYLKDISNGKIEFIFNPNHQKTKRFKAGQNPPVLAAIRYLAKLTQYSAEGSDENFAQVVKIISEADFSKLSGYAQAKVREFSLKALLNAPDVEFAWDILQRAGLREKLVKIDKENKAVHESLAWWMNKEPLRSSPLGEGTGKAAADIAKELDLDELIVSHETNSFTSYESLTRSARGEANVFISRANADHEAAAHGNGFYTQIGMDGARGGGITVRFKVHPDAREGRDFTRAYSFIVVHNKNALELIQENLNISLVNFIGLLLGGEIKNNDKGLMEKMRRKFNRSKAEETEAEFKKAAEMLIKTPVDKNSVNAFVFFLEQEQSVFFPEVENKFKKIFAKLSLYDLEKGIAKTVFSSQNIKDKDFFVRLFFNALKRNLKENIKNGLSGYLSDDQTRIWFEMDPDILEGFKEETNMLIKRASYMFGYNFFSKDWMLRKGWIESDNSAGRSQNAVLRYLRQGGELDAKFVRSVFKVGDLGSIEPLVVRNMKSIDIEELFSFRNEVIKEFGMDRTYGLFEKILIFMTLVKTYAQLDQSHEKDLPALDEAFLETIEFISNAGKNFVAREQGRAKGRLFTKQLLKFIANKMQINGSDQDEYVVIERLKEMSARKYQEDIKSVLKTALQSIIWGSLAGGTYMLDPWLLFKVPLMGGFGLVSVVHSIHSLEEMYKLAKRKLFMQKFMSVFRREIKASVKNEGEDYSCRALLQ